MFTLFRHTCELQVVHDPLVLLPARHIVLHSEPISEAQGCGGIIREARAILLKVLAHDPVASPVHSQTRASRVRPEPLCQSDRGARHQNSRHNKPQLAANVCVEYRLRTYSGGLRC